MGGGKENEEDDEGCERGRGKEREMKRIMRGGEV